MKMGRKKEKIFWGVFLILAAAFLVVGKLGFLQELGLWTILFAVFWAAVLIKGVIKLSFGEILFSIAFLCILFDEQLGIEALTPWTVLAAALLGTIGLNLLFRRRKHYYGGRHKETVIGDNVEFGDVVSFSQGEEVRCECSFGSATKYIDSADFRYAFLECSFGAMKVYFDRAVIPSGHGTVELDVSFSGVELYVPREWTVVNSVDTAFGGVDEKGRNQSEGTPVLTLSGEVNFSGVTVIYV